MPEGDVISLTLGIVLLIAGLSVLLGGALAGNPWCFLGLAPIFGGIALCVRGTRTLR